jgi:Fe-S cluster biogenesis protein NfuA
MTPQKTDSEIDKEIRRILSTHVMNYVISHGGNLEYCGYHDGIVRVRMSGSCTACSARNITLRFGVERMLRKECAEVDRVELVE